MNYRAIASLRVDGIPSVEVDAICRTCENISTFIVTESGWSAWRNGTLIQNALPELNKADRELLISGTCGDCWNKLFPKENIQ